MKKPIVKTNSGRLLGSLENSIEGFKYYAFKGIPYAKPPVGDLRFKVGIRVTKKNDKLIFFLIARTHHGY